MKVTAEVKAFLYKGSTISLKELRTPAGVSQLSFFSCDMSAHGYLHIGSATITIDIPDERTVIENAIASLHEQAAAIRAEATKKCTEIEAQIQNLLAIEYTPAPEAQPE